MAAARRRQRYSCVEVLDMVANDSESDEPAGEMSSESSSNENDGSDSSESTETNENSDSEHEAQQGRVRGRGRGRGARGRGARGRGARGRGERGRGRGERGRGRGEQGRGRGRGQRARRHGQPAQGAGQGQGTLWGRGGGDAPARGLDLDWDEYDWRDPYSSDWLPPFSERCGVLVDTTDYDPVQYFKIFFPDEAFELISMETNRYAEQYFDNPNDLPPNSRFLLWSPTSVKELQAYVALQICMGMCHKNDIEEYWSRFWLTETPFGRVMSRNRYELISSLMHFANNESERPERDSPDYDLLWKVRPLMNLCEPTYLTAYGPRCELAIDESIIKFKGRVSFRQYLPAKPYKWGIKQFVLAESKTGYALKFITYVGKGSIVQKDGFSVTESICLSLLHGFEHRGHKVFTDNYYTSPALYNELQRIGIGATGTVKAGRKGMPTSLHPSRLALQKGDDPAFMRNGDMVAVAWHDTKRVHFLSTTDTNNTIDKRIRQRGADMGYRAVEKPVIAELYNQHMGAVDILDQKLGSYAYPHKCNKWYSTIYHRLREVALINGYILYSKNAGDQAVSPKIFRERVVSGLLEGFDLKTKRPSRRSNEQHARLTGRHFIGQCQDHKYKPDCVVCSSKTIPGFKRKQTIYYCKQCKVPMCYFPCHEIYHTHTNFRQEAARVVYNL